MGNDTRSEKRRAKSSYAEQLDEIEKCMVDEEYKKDACLEIHSLMGESGGKEIDKHIYGQLGHEEFDLPFDNLRERLVNALRELNNNNNSRSAYGRGRGGV